MGPNLFVSSASLIGLSYFLLLSSAVKAHNITRLLSNYPEFDEFNAMLSKTHLVSEINRRSTITVLAIKDVSALSSKPIDIAKSILSTHVVLDYYDGYKLQRENKKSIILTTLFQSSGIAGGDQGFLNVTKGNGEIRFGSAVPGSARDSKLIRLVVAHPYNISVLEVSSLIVAPGIDGNFTFPPPPRAPAPAPPKALSPKKAPVPTPEEEEAESPVAEEPTSPSEAPASDAPASSPPEAPPADETSEKDAPAPSKSSGSRVAFGTCAAVVLGLVSSLVAF